MRARVRESGVIEIGKSHVRGRTVRKGPLADLPIDGSDLFFGDFARRRTIELVADLPATDRIKVVQATYRSAVLTAERRRLESIKSEAEILQELELAAGEKLHLPGVSNHLA